MANFAEAQAVDSCKNEALQIGSPQACPESAAADRRAKSPVVGVRWIRHGGRGIFC